MNSDNTIAVYVDFENVALGLKDEKQPEFDIHIVLEKLLNLGRILVKNAYSDWQRYRDYRKALHESGFVLIEIPHTKYAGKNSADIKMVVDALDLCYTRDHIDTFALISGDSDFTPLVNKLRENGKTVIGIGVRNSSSGLLIESCDDFWYYDELTDKPSIRSGNQDNKALDESKLQPHSQIFEQLTGTARSLLEHRGEFVWASHVKQALKRKQPNFSERSLGYGSFSEVLEEAQDRNLIELQKDVASGSYKITRVTNGKRSLKHMS
jgi:uncharacterized protein (TIGR00288 family)